MKAELHEKRLLRNAIFGLNLGELMRQADLGEIQLAKKAKISRCMVFKYLTGDDYPSERTLRKLARALGSSVEDLKNERRVRL